MKGSLIRAYADGDRVENAKAIQGYEHLEIRKHRSRPQYKGSVSTKTQSMTTRCLHGIGYSFTSTCVPFSGETFVCEGQQTGLYMAGNRP